MDNGMEKKGKQIILNCEKLERRFALLNNGRLEEYQIERDDHEPKVGDIYLGRIINLEPSLQAAFVDIGAEKNAFLHYHEMLPGCGEMLERRGEQDSDSDEEEPGEESIQARRRKRQEARPGSKVGAEAQRRKKKLTVADIPAIFRPGMEILVQVVKSPISTKGARVTTDISIPGRYLVLAALELPEGMGLICRTVGEGRRSTFFKRDLELLLDYWRKVEKEMDSRNAPALLFTEPNLVERTIRDFMTEEIEGIVVDDPAAGRQIIDTLKRFGGRKMASRRRYGVW